MKTKLGFLLGAILLLNQSIAQCDFATNAQLSGDTLHCVGGDIYRSVVAYNPVVDLYYSINAGGGSPNEFFDASGTQLGDDISADFRGLWYNENNGQIEGNCWDYYFKIDSLTSQGYLGGTIGEPLGTGAVTSPPFNQCVGVYDPDEDNILYYYDDTLWGESRSTLTDITPVELTGANLSNVIEAQLIYTDCAGKEIGLYDNVAKDIYLFNKTTGVLAETISLPSNAPTISYNNYGIGYANEIFWVFSDSIWIGYDIHEAPSTANAKNEEFSYIAAPNPFSNMLELSFDQETDFKIYDGIGKEFGSFQGEKSYQLNTEDFPTGIYVVVTSLGKRIKLIKN